MKEKIMRFQEQVSVSESAPQRRQRPGSYAELFASFDPQDRGFKNRDDWYKKQNRVRGKLAASGMHAVSAGRRRESQGSADGGEVWGPDSPVSSPLSPGTGRSGRSRAMFFLFKVQTLN